VPLGRILVSNGWLDEETLAEAIAYQANLPRIRLTEELLLTHRGSTFQELGTRYRAVYVGLDVAQRPLLAVASALGDDAMAELEATFGAPPRLRIARESEIAIALRILSGQSGGFGAVSDGTAGIPLLGDMLIEQGLLKRKVFEDAMQTYRPDRHGRVGDYLVQQGVIVREVVERVVDQQRLMHAELGRARA
jgi:adsorption protein B